MQTNNSEPVWPRNAALAVIAALAAFLVLRQPAEAPQDTDMAVPAASAPAVRATPGTAADERPMAPPAELFPARMANGTDGVFTRLGATVMESCTARDSVGPSLAGRIRASKGCVGEEIALYKDAHGDRFNLAVFTMKDPRDTLRLVTWLMTNFGDYQVAAQTPPRGSGLPVLPADSGMVQSFAGVGRVMIVGLAQWSDGRVRDYQELTDRLQPLVQGAARNIARYETAAPVTPHV
ncbi:MULTISPECIES: hypothetical protein [unclassified Streptomyces]|uniref:hypothetical protein n=1 Tax=unclassified Streptomyces TaxID=2593676 RepID=UPI00381DA846